MNKDFKFRRVITREQEELFMRNGEMDRMKREGEQIGFARGVEQTNIDTINNMLKDNLSIDLISKYVNLPIEQVNKIIKSIKVTI